MKLNHLTFVSVCLLVTVCGLFVLYPKRVEAYEDDKRRINEARAVEREHSQDSCAAT